MAPSISAIPRSSGTGRYGGISGPSSEILTAPWSLCNEEVNLELLEEMIYHRSNGSGRWKEGLTTADELNLNVFLTEEADGIPGAFQA
jgi:hypothetical protein